MKPVISVFLPLGVLFAAAVCNRITATASPAVPLLHEADAIALFPRIQHATQPISLGVLPVDKGENQALRVLKERAANESQSAPISVTWSDAMKHSPIDHRAIYDPARGLLFYQTHNCRPCVYIGVSQDGMEAALESNTLAPFATAHTLSVHSLAALAQL